MKIIHPSKFNINKYNELLAEVKKFTDPTLIMIQGLPGSGKTTLAKKLSYDLDIDFFEADHYFEKLGYFDGNKLNEAHSECLRNARNELHDYNNCIVSNTSLTDEEVNRYKELFNSVYLIKMTTHFGSIHNIPKKTLDKMKKKTCSIKPDFVI